MVNLCVPPIVKDQCCLSDVCFECAVSSPDAFGDEIIWNETVTSYLSTIPLFFIGLWNLYLFFTVRRQTNYKYMPVLRMNSAMYAIGTGIFGLSRIYYQISRPVLTLAALHNLNEWIFGSFAFFSNPRQRNLAMLASSVFIFVIIGLVNVMITELEIYSATEQIPGLAIDIFLPIIWWILYQQNRRHNKQNEQAQYVYLTAFAAHFVHLFLTIFPLIIEQLTRNQSETLSRLMAFFVFLSVPWNHLMYTRFVTLYETHIDKIYDDKKEEEAEQLDINTLVNSPKCITSRCGKMLFWYSVCLVLSLFPNVIIPIYLIGPCDVDQSESVSHPQPYFMGTTVVEIEDGFNEAFEYQFKSKHLRSNALNFEGNKYYFIGKDNENDNKYIFNEGWESLEAVQKWIGSEYVKSVFSEYTQPMLVSTTMSSYTAILDEIDTNKQDMAFGAVSYTFKNWQSGCQALWNHMKDINDCQWLAVMDHCQVIDAENGVRRQYFKQNPEQYLTSTWPVMPYEEEMVDPLDAGNTIKRYRYEYYIAEIDRRSNLTLTYDANKYGNNSCHFQYHYKTNLSLDNLEESTQRFFDLTAPLFDALNGVHNESESAECSEPSKRSATCLTM